MSDDPISEFISKMQKEAETQAKIIEEQQQDNQSARNVMIATINTPEALTKLFQDYARDPGIREGAIVRWKEGFRNRTVSGPFVVVEKIPRENCVRVGYENTQSDIGVASHLFLEPVDVRVAFIAPEAGDDHILMYWLDSQRLEVVT